MGHLGGRQPQLSTFFWFGIGRAQTGFPEARLVGKTEWVHRIHGKTQDQIHGTEETPIPQTDLQMNLKSQGFNKAWEGNWSRYSLDAYFKSF